MTRGKGTHEMEWPEIQRKLDTQSLNQLGYTFKDLAFRYRSTGKHERAEELIEKASGYFQSVLRLAPDDAGAHLGGDFENLGALVGPDAAGEAVGKSGVSHVCHPNRTTR